MRKVSISFDAPQIEVNGIVFDLHKSDGDIFTDALKIVKRYEAMDMNDPDNAIAAMEEISGYVDTILGEGAMKKISGGKEVGMRKAIECMIIIANAALSEYAGEIADKYEDAPQPAAAIRPPFAMTKAPTDE